MYTNLGQGLANLKTCSRKREEGRRGGGCSSTSLYISSLLEFCVCVSLSLYFIAVKWGSSSSSFSPSHSVLIFCESKSKVVRGAGVTGLTAYIYIYIIYVDKLYTYNIYLCLNTHS